MPFFLRRSAAPLPYAPGSPEGLAARWVRWVAGIGRGTSPVADATGEWAGLGQPDDVWFLAGTFGGTARRRCTVPAGVPLFAPAVNMWRDAADGPPPVLERGFGQVLVNGVPVPLRTVTASFEAAGARGNPVTATRRPVALTVWGLWAHTEPLLPGTHEVQIEGGDGYGFTVGASYTVDAVAR